MKSPTSVVVGVNTSDLVRVDSVLDQLVVLKEPSRCLVTVKIKTMSGGIFQL